MPQMKANKDARGHFLPGNSISVGKGRPRKKVEEDYQNAFYEACSKNDWKRIVKMAIRQALDGDKDARKWLSDNMLGLPIQRVASASNPTENPYASYSDSQLVVLAQSIASKNVSKLTSRAKVSAENSN